MGFGEGPLLDKHVCVQTSTSRTYGANEMRVELVQPLAVTEPSLWARPDQVLAMVLRPGSIEIGERRTQLREFRHVAGDMILPRRQEGKWVGLMSAPYLQLSISDETLRAASDGEVELRMYRKFEDTRLHGLLTAVHAEMLAGFRTDVCFWIQSSRP